MLKRALASLEDESQSPGISEPPALAGHVELRGRLLWSGAPLA